LPDRRPYGSPTCPVPGLQRLHPPQEGHPKEPAHKPRHQTTLKRPQSAFKDNHHLVCSFDRREDQASGPLVVVAARFRGCPRARRVEEVLLPDPDVVDAVGAVEILVLSAGPRKARPCGHANVDSAATCGGSYRALAHSRKLNRATLSGARRDELAGMDILAVFSDQSRLVGEFAGTGCASSGLR